MGQRRGTSGARSAVSAGAGADPGRPGGRPGAGPDAALDLGSDLGPDVGPDTGPGPEIGPEPDVDWEPESEPHRAGESGPAATVAPGLPGPPSAEDVERAARVRATARVAARAAARRRELAAAAGRPSPAGDGSRPAAGGAARSAAGGPEPDEGEPAEPPPPVRGLVVVGPGAAFSVPLLRRFVREGFTVGVLSRSADTVDRVAGQLAAEGIAVAGEVADVTDATAFAAAFGRLSARMGGASVVIYNAKLSIRGGPLTARPETVNATLAVNVTGALTTAQVAVTHLAGRPGACLLVTAAGPRVEPAPNRFALAVGKAALLALGGSLEPLLRREGVRLRTVVLDARIAPDGPLAADAVADHYWNAYAAPRGSVFRIAPATGGAKQAQLFLDLERPEPGAGPAAAAGEGPAVGNALDRRSPAADRATIAARGRRARP
jgi:NADP-dependent 3-hydroxy acid dehydrogenase YdfG